MTQKFLCPYCGASTEAESENQIRADGGQEFCSGHCELEFQAEQREEVSKEDYDL